MIMATKSATIIRAKHFPSILVRIFCLPNSRMPSPMELKPAPMMTMIGIVEFGSLDALIFQPLQYPTSPAESLRMSVPENA
jgi:hypothetical protein